jgi:solute carrier family 32 (vesicular inhibitory amino acid transporter)
MFGDGVMDEITSNIIGTSGYPKSLIVIMCVLIAIVPLTKIPLNAQPIISTVERLTGLDVQVAAESDPLVGLSSLARGLLKVTLRVLIIAVFVVIAILFSAFDRIMAFMGSALCFTVCVVLPCVFHLKIFGKKIGPAERMFNYFLIVVCSSLAVVGTVFAFLPKSKIGAD